MMAPLDGGFLNTQNALTLTVWLQSAITNLVAPNVTDRRKVYVIILREFNCFASITETVIRY